ncbi:Sterile alpha motif [Nakaseomyces bracarensis]|uniref:Sterile alpha motif n=1 Tax=Nakaseomyces bracarensis TaxID=273131 RepID=A0ABR4NRX2_9SACH
MGFPLYVCVNEYRRRMEDEIDLKPGDKVEVLTDDGEYNDGWYYGKNLRTLKTGLYPAVFTRMVSVDGRVGAKSDKRVPTPKLEQQNSFPSESSRTASTVHTTLNEIDQALEELRKDSLTLSQPSLVVSERSAGSRHSSTHSHSSRGYNLVKTQSRTPSRQEVLSWSAQEVTNYFLSRGYDETLASKFLAHGITGIILIEMSIEHLKEIDINSFGIRFEVDKEISRLRSIVYSSSATTTPRLHSNNWNDSKSSTVTGNRESVLISPPSITNANERPYKSLDDLPPPSASTVNGMTPGRNHSNPHHQLGIEESFPVSRGNVYPTIASPEYEVPAEILKNKDIFESPGKAPKPPSYPSAVQPPPSPMVKPRTQFNKGQSPYMVNPPKFDSRAGSIASSASRINSSNSILTSSSDLVGTPTRYKFPGGLSDRLPNPIETKINNGTNSVITSSTADSIMNSSSGASTDTNPTFAFPDQGKQNIGGLKRNSVVYKGHKKTESGGSFVDLFNRISMLSPGKEDTGDMTSVENGHRRSSSAATYQHHRRSSSSSTFQNHSRKSSQNLAHARQPSVDGQRHRRNSSRLSFFGGKGDNFLQNLSPNIKSTSHSRKSSFISSPFKQQFTDAVLADGTPTSHNNHSEKGSAMKSPQRSKSPHKLSSTPKLRSASEMEPKKELKSNQDRIKDIMENEEEKKRSVSEDVIKDKAAKLSKPVKPALRKQQTSAFQEGLRSITVQEAMKTADCSGWMSKKGSGAMGTWKERFFVLQGTRLSYFASLNDTRERGLIDITAHRVVAANEDDKLVALYAASVGKGRFCMKLLPPQPGSKKGLTFTQPKIHYLAVSTRDEMRAWLSALIKATIDFDTSVPVISSYATSTVSLKKAKEMLVEARKATEERDHRTGFDEADEDQLYWEEQLKQEQSGSTEFSSTNMPKSPDYF